MQPASSITPDRRDESYEAATAAVRSKGQGCGAFCLACEAARGLEGKPPCPRRLCVGLWRCNVDHFEDHVASSSRPSAVYDTEPVQSCGVT